MKKRTKYTKDMPRALYTFFTRYGEGAGAPSFQKFARSVGVTLNELDTWRDHREFDRAYRECSEIRRDYLIDSALTRRFDPSLVKYLLQSEYESEAALARSPDDIKITLEVVGE